MFFHSRQVVVTRGRFVEQTLCCAT